jgi:hypothetical protein
MKFRIFLTVIAGFFCTLLVAQDVTLTSEKYPEMRYLGVSGNVYYNAYQQIRGSAFLISDWTLGDVYFKNGINVKNVNLKIDLYSHQVIMYQDILKRIVTLDKKEVTTFVLKDQGKERKFNLENITRSKSASTDGLYVEILTEGKIVFQKVYYKERIFLTTPVKPFIYEFVDGKEYRLKYNSKDIIISLNKRTLYKLFPENKQELKQYIRNLHLKLKKEEDFSKAISFISGLKK